MSRTVSVAPYTGAWIEISCYYCQRVLYLRVAPYTGAWIEITQLCGCCGDMQSRPLYGGVD